MSFISDNTGVGESYFSFFYFFWCSLPVCPR